MKTPMTCEICSKLITRTRQTFAMDFYMITLEQILIKVFTFTLLTLRMFPPSRKTILLHKKIKLNLAHTKRKNLHGDGLL